MKTVKIKVPIGSYPVYIGSDILFPAAKALSEKIGLKKAFILADRRVKTVTQKLAAALEDQGWKVSIREVEVSENLKNLRRIYPLFGQLLNAGADRNTVLFAVGGGVIGDTGGFVAATFLRGIPWVGVPTTLLAQVDSSVGGKTAVNHSAGKNLVGAFHQPVAVICELQSLNSLATRDLYSGLGEIVKYALIKDPELLSTLKAQWRKIFALDPIILESIVTRCIWLKARAIRYDELDRKGLREVLNFGHTIGHALESATQYGYFRHGEAVILGMRAAVHLSCSQKHLTRELGQEILEFLESIPVPPVPTDLPDADLLGYITHDKKTMNGKTRFILLKRPGETVQDTTVSTTQIREVLSYLKRRGRR